MSIYKYYHSMWDNLSTYTPRLSVKPEIRVSNGPFLETIHAAVEYHVEATRNADLQR